MAVGSVALFTQATGTALPVDADGWAAFDFDTETSDADNIFTRTAAGVYRADVTGRFLIIAEATTLDTSNGRFNPALRILDDAAAYVPGSIISAYSRNTANDVASPGAHAVLDLTALDTITVQDGKSVADDPTGNYVAGARLIIIQLDDTAALLHVGTPTSAAHGGTTRSVVAGWDVITETDDTVIELNADGQTIDLKGQDTGYLVLGSMHNSDGGGSRTQRVGDIAQDGSVVPNLVGGNYSRNNANEWATVALRGAVVTGAAASELNVGLQLVEWAHATIWGTPIAGSWVLSTADSGLWVVEVPLEALSIFYDSTGLELISGNTNTILSAFRDTDRAGTNVTRNSATEAEVDVAGDYLALAAARGITASPGANSRMSVGLRAIWNAVAGVGSNQYTRNDQSTQDDPRSAFRAVHMEIGASAADTIEIEKFTPTSVTNYGFTHDTIADRLGVVIVDLALLATAGGTDYQETATDDEDVTDTTARVHDAVRTSTDDSDVTDATLRALDRTRTATDDTDVTDTVTALKTALSASQEDVGIEDQTLHALDIARTITDAVDVTDDTITAEDNFETATDPADVTDQVLAVKSSTVEIVEDVDVTDDTIDVVSGDILEAVTDDLDVTDQTLTVFDAVRSTTDSVDVADQTLHAKTVLVTITDSIDVTDDTIPVETGDITETVTDPADVTDSTARIVAGVRTVTDDADITDAVSTVLDNALSVTDDADITDTVLTALVVSSIITDNVDATDSLVLQGDLKLHITVDVGVLDATTTDQPVADAAESWGFIPI